MDSSFLLKTSGEAAKKSEYVTRDLCKNRKDMYEKITSPDVAKPLYSVKRKLVVSKPDIDTMAWKKQQTEYQWKYKQKTISELHSFVKESAPKPSITDSLSEAKANIPSFPSIDFASRLKDEEKKMEEFELFMNEIHSYLENETCDEAESDFKWMIQSYLDLIEEEKAEVAFSDLNTVGIASALPNTGEIKERLFDNVTEMKKTERTVGKIDMSTILHQATSIDVKKSKTITEIKENSTSKIKSQLESCGKENSPAEKVTVKRKLIELPYAVAPAEPQKPRMSGQEWQYKKKTMGDLHKFIKKNQDIAPASIKCEGFEQIDSKSLLERSNKIKDNLDSKEEEFKRFLNELDSFSKSPSNIEEEASFKEGIKQYISLIEDSKKKKRNANMPVLDSPLKVSDIKSKLGGAQNISEPKKKSTPIGKISQLFTSPSQEKSTSTASREKEILPKSGNASFMKRAFERKTNLVRSASEMCINYSKLKKDKVSKFESKNANQNSDEKSPINYTHVPDKRKPQKDDKTDTTVTSHRSPDKVRNLRQTKPHSEWDHIQDPEERKNAILAKYGFKPAKKYADEDTSDIEDILNYENHVDVNDYSEKLKELYNLDDSTSDSDRESSPVRRNDKGSFSSLLNIMKVMKKSRMSKKFSDSLTKVSEFGKDSFKCQSEVEPVVSGSCSNIKQLFESGQVYKNENMKQVNEKDWELCSSQNKKPLKDIFLQSINTKSVTEKREMSDDLEFSSLSSLKSRYENRDSGLAPTCPNKGSAKKLSLPINMIDGEDEVERNGYDGVNQIANELEALRQLQQKKSIFRTERGRSFQNDNSPTLKRSVSCIGISKEKIVNDLDEDTLRDVHVSNSMIKAMFESAAPKYKFGGSGSNLSVNSSKEDVSRGPVRRPSSKPKEDRKWVLDSINKYFDVIVEESESSGSECCESQSICSLSEESDDDESASLSDDEPEPNYQSTAKIRGLFSTVVSGLSKSMGNLAKTELVNNLKKNLGSRVNLRESFENIHQ